MGGLGQTMIFWRRAALGVVLLAGVLCATAGWAAGLDVGLEIIALDAGGAYSKVPAALGVSFDALLALLADQGLPPGQLTAIEADLDTAAANVSSAVAGFPEVVPVPLVAGGVEIPLGLVFVDALRLSAGFVDSGIVRGIAGAAGITVPSPLLEQSFDLDGETAHLALDVGVSAWSAAIEARKRFDLILGALSLCTGVGYTSCSAAVDVEREVPDEWASGVDAAVSALHLDEIHTSAFAAHVGARLEAGVPFLRVYAEARLVQPILEWVGWWDLHVGGLAGTVGVVIRF